MNLKKYLDSFNLNNQTILITGAAGGIGSALSFHLASLNVKLMLAGRTGLKLDNLKSEILKKYPNTDVEILTLDLCSKKSVDEFIENVKNIKIDFFFHNAGVYNVPRHNTELGFDNIFQTNCLMPYYISKRLMDNFKQNRTKLVFMGSIAYNYSKIDQSDIQFLKCKKPSKVYGNSKRVAMAALSELFKEKGVEFSIIHPGVTLTHMTNHYPKIINWLVKIVLGLVCPKPKIACLSFLYATNHHTDFDEWIGPKIFNTWGNPKISKTKLEENDYKFCHDVLESMIQNFD